MTTLQLQSKPTISLRSLFGRFKWKISWTLTLVLLESLLDLLFPLFIGFAINGLLAQSYMGVIQLATLGFALLIIGSGRRYYDTRTYAAIYTTTASEMVEQEHERKTAVSAIAARATLLTEFVEFLENSLPLIITSLIGIVGILLIIVTLNLSVFAACLALLILMVLVYLTTAKKNFQFNQNYNDQLEKQVDSLASKDFPLIKTHFNTVMRWNIKLSDLETLNYAIIWLGIIGLLAYAPIAVVQSGVTNYGLIFSILIYVFQYIEGIITLPYFIQQLIRLQEISQRLSHDIQTPQP